MSNFTMELPAAVSFVLERLSAVGHESWLVGGCVRDAVMGMKPHDFDVTASAMPEETIAAFEGFRIIETGLKHGTVTVLVEGEPVEITTYRVEGDYLDHRHPSSVSFTRSVEEDLKRRDFTVNAMAYSPLRGFADPEGVLTGVETRSSSPVRILRDETYQSAVRGLFPCGEGAGYAGGIVSAAVDGIRIAEAVAQAE